jgi:hypothetical protein
VLGTNEGLRPVAGGEKPVAEAFTEGLEVLLRLHEKIYCEG